MSSAICVVQVNHHLDKSHWCLWMKGDCRIFCYLGPLGLDLWTVPTTVINSVLGDCHLFWSVFCPLLSSPHTYFSFSESILHLHFILFNQIICLISFSTAAVVSLSD